MVVQKGWNGFFLDPMHISRNVWTEDLQKMIEAFFFSFLTKCFIGSQRLEVPFGMIVEGEGIQAEVHMGFPSFTGSKGFACLDMIDGGQMQRVSRAPRDKPILG